MKKKRYIYKKSVSKLDIYRCVKKYARYEPYIKAAKPEDEEDKEINYIKGLDKRLNKIISFLSDKEVRNVLEQKTENNLGNFFYNKEMNLTEAEGEAFKAYNYTYTDVIFLGVLLSLYNHPSFSDYRKKRKKMNSNRDKAWVEAYTEELDSFAEYGIKRAGRKRWGTIRLNIESLLHRFILIDLPEVTEVRQELYDMVESFTSLPDSVQIQIYEDGMKSRIEYIGTIIKKYSDAYDKLDSDVSTLENNGEHTNKMNEFDSPSPQFLRELDETDRRYQ